MPSAGQRADNRVKEEKADNRMKWFSLAMALLASHLEPTHRVKGLREARRMVDEKIKTNIEQQNRLAAQERQKTRLAVADHRLEPKVVLTEAKVEEVEADDERAKKKKRQSQRRKAALRRRDHRASQERRSAEQPAGFCLGQSGACLDDDNDDDDDDDDDDADDAALNSTFTKARASLVKENIDRFADEQSSAAPLSLEQAAAHQAGLHLQAALWSGRLKNNTIVVCEGDCLVVCERDQ